MFNNNNNNIQCPNDIKCGNETVEKIKSQLSLIDPSGSPNAYICSSGGVLNLDNFEKGLKTIKYIPASVSNLGPVSLSVIEKYKKLGLSPSDITVYFITKSYDGTDVNDNKALYALVQAGLDVVIVESVSAPKTTTLEAVKYIQLDQLLDHVRSTCSGVPIITKVFLEEDKIQKVHDDLNLKIYIRCTGCRLLKGTQVEFSDNPFYSPFLWTLDEDSNSTWQLIHVTLEAKSKKFDLPPACVNFIVRMPNSKIEVSGSIEVPLALFTGELVTLYDICFILEGLQGIGKSTLLNTLFNVFTIGKIRNLIQTSKEAGQSNTKTYSYYPIHKLLQEEEDAPRLYKDMIDKLRWIMGDKAGMMLLANGERINYSVMAHQFDGRFANGSETMGDSNANYKVHCCIIVTTPAVFSEPETSPALKLIKEKMVESNQNGQQSILVVTKCDLQTAEGLEKLKTALAQCPTEKGNIFLVDSYIDNSLDRVSRKDRTSFRLLLKIKEEASKRVKKFKMQQEIDAYMANERRDYGGPGPAGLAGVRPNQQQPDQGQQQRPVIGLNTHMPVGVPFLNNRPPLPTSVKVTVETQDAVDTFQVPFRSTFDSLCETIESDLGLDMETMTCKFNGCHLRDPNHMFEEDCKIVVMPKMPATVNSNSKTNSKTKPTSSTSSTTTSSLSSLASSMF
ncbi:hypothetical protein SAMD00019534_070090 [Acytostelium subglobosum LB1]|uniref:hypothetical protein n=1 Tax=Acytostelium subglobosum LB1 TaxID=1410327 RepID=UPI000644BBE8|nr:hypothetical protein SAMD00019534_070090 [Acytostelium subglobosum LB1]GAM23834.1 hypothetical protein SAMD00019534_070090 [Acytostelium subglobosum LB1]|eukprot:XP_012752870.1 hypothetical protein SAMD00019534_070090 [Acytostelium subglobosum LB1]